MKRGYTALEYKSIVRRLRAARPELSLTSDFIVGFPGETDADFEQTMKLVDDVGFDGAFSFAYSPRPGTPAAELADQVPPRGAAGAPRSGCRRCSTRSTARTATRWSARGSACWSPAAPHGRARACRAHRQQPRRQLRRRRGARSARYVDVTITAALRAFAARRTRRRLTAVGPPRRRPSDVRHRSRLSPSRGIRCSRSADSRDRPSSARRARRLR